MLKANLNDAGVVLYVSMLGPAAHSSRVDKLAQELPDDALVVGTFYSRSLLPSFETHRPLARPQTSNEHTVRNARNKPPQHLNEIIHQLFPRSPPGLKYAPAQMPVDSSKYTAAGPIVTAVSWNAAQRMYVYRKEPLNSEGTAMRIRGEQPFRGRGVFGRQSKTTCL